ncbi:hypothetical protein CC86DRAFT_386201 [Ophiobolus disseminans]|uniref:AAA+ ATPase domain-containing protein n=1 Tax=Ophiobolus disseminans TaxID=1469910 RepID=A0A6A6ZNL7_9PLEO|nr:hypothetical protein CC86DRAFT_386201 [Ophiobolus disseminans]
MPSHSRNTQGDNTSAASGAMAAAGNLGLLAAVNTDFGRQICHTVKIRTGFDIHMAVAVCLAANTARSTVPAVLNTVFDQVKTNVSSSITVSYNDFQLYNGLLRLAREKAAANDKSWYRFSGQHEQISGGVTQSLPEKHGTAATVVAAAPRDPRYPNNAPAADQSYVKVIVRCLGHSNAPVLELFSEVRKQIVQGRQLGVTRMAAGVADATIQCNKRPLATVDLEPALMAHITHDAEVFFGEDSREFYESTGQPYRRGYLLYGPPGTGKTSLSVALASHFNVPLIGVTLRGMDDKDLMDAFNRLPSACVVLLEDVDCVGAEVGNRDAKAKAKSKGPAESLESAALHASHDAMYQRLMAQQAAAQHQTTAELAKLKSIVSDELGVSVDNYMFYDRATGQTKPGPVVSSPPNPNKKVTLSGLLNVIDGADAAEGRLLLMTTNCPEVLDDALLRAGRVDEKFKIDFATKVTAELTFKRIFGLDKRNRFRPATIDRFAQAFAAQFPSRSRICTAELAKYCGQYRSRPEKAIEEFADWLKLGNDMFAYRREDLVSSAGDDGFNVPEAFDPALLAVGPEDLVDPDTLAPTAAPLPLVKDLRFKWNPARWFSGSSADDFSSIRDELLASADDSSVHATLFDGFCTSVDPPVTDRVPVSSYQAQAIGFYASRPALNRFAFSTHFSQGSGPVLQRLPALSVVHRDIDIDAMAESGCRPPVIDVDDDLTLVSPHPIDDDDTHLPSLFSAGPSSVPDDDIESSLLSDCDALHSHHRMDSAVNLPQATALDEDDDEFFDALEH